MLKRSWKIDLGKENEIQDASVEARLAYLHRAQKALSTIIMTIRDDCLSATVDTEQTYES